MKRSVILLVSILTIPALVALAIVAVRKGAAAPSAASFLIAIEVAIAAALVLTALATAAAAAREPQLSRYGTLVLVIACAFSAAIGRHPGLFSNAGEALAAVLLIAVAATAVIRRMNDRDAARLGFWTITFGAAIAAGWQVGVEPLLAFILVLP